jgi:hypothetical protein
VSDAALDEAFEAEERTAREARRAAFLATRNAEAAAKAHEAERVAVRVHASARRLELREGRGEVLAKLCAKLQKFDQLRVMLNELVETVDEDLAADAELCAEHNDLRAAAGEHEKLVPIDADVLQAAVGLELSESWDDGEQALESWLSTRAMPRRADDSPEAYLTRQGARLLDILKEHDHG